MNIARQVASTKGQDKSPRAIDGHRLFCKKSKESKP